MKKIIFTFIALVIAFPVFAQENPYAIETKVIQNQQQLKLLQQQQAQLYLKLEDLLVKYGEIKGELNDIRHRLDAIQSQINEILLRNTAVSKRQQPVQPKAPGQITSETIPSPPQNKPQLTMKPAKPAQPSVAAKNIPAPKPPPKPVIPEDKRNFDKALELYKNKKYDSAIAAFKSFKEKYKRSKLVPDAIFYLAESYFAKGQYDKAIINYDYLVNTYPKSSKVPDATLKEGLAFIKMGDKIDGEYLLRKVINQYPDTKAAEIARKYLK